MISGACVLAIVAIISQVSACPLTASLSENCVCSSVGNYGSGVFSSPALVSASPSVVSSNCYGSDVFSTPSVVASPSVVSSNCYGSDVFSTPSVVSNNCFGNNLASPSVQERVSPGTYQVALDNAGPCSTRSLPVIRTRATAPVQERPTVRIPASIPAPRTVCNRCQCVKTIVKPQVIEQIVTVPTVQRYIQTTTRPVVEKIHYSAVPVNSCGSEVSGVSSGYGFSGVTSGYSVADSCGSVCEPQVLVSGSQVVDSCPSSQTCACF